jgi:hypothetical protein
MKGLCRVVRIVATLLALAAFCIAVLWLQIGGAEKRGANFSAGALGLLGCIGILATGWWTLREARKGRIRWSEAIITCGLTGFASLTVWLWPYR